MRIKRVDIQLRKCCAGLLEVSDREYFRRGEDRDTFFAEDPSANIQYHHRTAKDFLDGKDVQSLLVETQQGDQFSPSAALVRGRLASYQTLCTPILYCLEQHKTEEDWQFLKSIDATLILARQAEIETGTGHVQDIDRLNTTIERIWHPSHRTTRHWGEHTSFDRYSHRPDYWNDDFLGVAVAYRLHHYVAQKLGGGNSILLGKQGRPYLDYALAHALISPGIYSLDMVKVLLAHGAEPNKTFERFVPYTDQTFADRSPWQNFLENGLMYPETEQIMELLLQHGADPSVAVAAVKQSTQLDPNSKEKLLTLISKNQKPTLLHRLLQLVYGP